MCIRDRLLGGNAALRELLDAAHARNMYVVLDGVFNHASRGCLLYTSDAADERSSVDLGGRRIIKKKNNARVTESPW